jgi:hypothetical protein
MSTLYNNKYSVILGGTATLRGAVQNDTEPKHKHKIYVGEGPGSNITVSGNTTDKTVVYSHASSLPIINPDGLEQYATILLVNGIVTIPEGAVSFYIANNFLPKSTPLTSSYSCSASSCPASLLITYQSTSPATWSIGNIPAFIYSNQDVNVTSTVTLQLTVASTGNIATGNGVTIYPFGSLSSTIYSTTNYCNLYGELPICNNQVDPAIPYSSVQGVIYVVSGSNNVGTSDKFYGDVASIGELSVSGSGGDRFGGAIIAEGGYTGTKGILKILNPVASADSATLGGYQLTASSIRWVP